MIRLEEVSKRFPDGQIAVHQLSLDVSQGEVCVLVGPSGCGKTTTLKMVNRLIEPSSGRILLDEEDLGSVDPVQLRRRMGYVIQQVGLFPHLTVADNVATVPRLLGWDRHRVRARVRELLELVGLDPDRFGPRYPHQLSGGQRQRVGVARALGVDPPVLLMDEPFGAIDPVNRERLQQEFLSLQKTVRKTVMFVTHDVDEAIRLADRIAVLSQGGVLEQYDPPAALLRRPSSGFVADFLGADRGLKRLAVTPISVRFLEHPPLVGADATLDEARQAMEAAQAEWAVVADADRRVHGWLSRQEASVPGRVADRVRPLDTMVPLEASLKEALAEMLRHDRRWVAVLDGARYLGVLGPDSLLAAMRAA